MKPSADCIRLIQEFEGYAKKLPDGGCVAYPDPATGGDPWTIGWGTTGPDVKPGTVWTRAKADQRFAEHVDKFAAGVSLALGAKGATQHQFDAMAAFAYNVGLANFQSSTLLKKHLQSDYAGAAAQFARWNKAAGKVLPGLTRRRAAEAALYRGHGGV